MTIRILVVWALAVGVGLTAGCGQKSSDEENGPETPEVAGNGAPVAPAAPVKPPTDAEQDEATRLLTQALAARDAGKANEAITLFRRTADTHPATWAGKKSALELGKILARSRDTRAEALTYLERGRETAETRDEDRSVRETIERLRRQTATTTDTTQPTITTRYTVRRGDALERIARSQGVQVQHLRLANRDRAALLSRDMIHPGDSLAIDNTMPIIRVTKSNFTLRLIYKDEVVAQYPVGVGAPGSETPLGEFTITEIAPKPSYTPTGATGVVYPYGHPKNPIGEIWMPFRNTPERQGYGIHGTNDPPSIGQRQSNGCIRMHNDDVVALSRLVPAGTRVIVER